MLVLPGIPCEHFLYLGCTLKKSVSHKVGNSRICGLHTETSVSHSGKLLVPANLEFYQGIFLRE